jgi:hypothetical protein
MAYTVRLIDCTDSISSDDQAAISGQLNTWIAAADSTRPTDKRLGVNASWVTSLDSPKAARLVIYFVTDRGSSVLKFMRNFKNPQNWDRLSGLTFSDSHPFGIHGGVRHFTRDELSACEVYTAKSGDAKAMTTYAFHEAMHNQLHMGDEMHGDQKVGGGIAADTVKPGTTPTSENLTALGSAMDTVRPQWVEGYARAHPKNATTPLRPDH